MNQPARFAVSVQKQSSDTDQRLKFKANLAPPNGKWFIKTNSLPRVGWLHDQRFTDKPTDDLNITDFTNNLFTPTSSNFFSIYNKVTKVSWHNINITTKTIGGLLTTELQSGTHGFVADSSGAVSVS